MKIEYKSVTWWLWVVTALLLAAGLVGWPHGFPLAMYLTVGQIVYFSMKDKSVTSFTVQIRIAILLILVAGTWEPMRWIYWLPLTGISVRSLTGYCFMARVLSLMPWNRKVPLTADLVKKTFLSPPVEGSVIQAFQG